MNPTTRVGVAAAIAAGLFGTLWLVELGGGLEPIDRAGDAFANLFRTDRAYDATCQDGWCRYEKFSWADGYGLIGTKAPDNGTWGGTIQVEESTIPWSGIPMQLGDEHAAVAVIVASILALLMLGAWRTAAIATGVALVGGLLVQPLKYGGDWAPYPSGHTIGAMLAWGIALVLVREAAARHGRKLPVRVSRAVVAWAAIAFLVGMDLVDVGAHRLGDILLGWSFGAAMVLWGWWLDLQDA